MCDKSLVNYCVHLILGQENIGYGPMNTKKRISSEYFFGGMATNAEILNRV